MEAPELDNETIDALNSDDDYSVLRSSSWLAGEIADEKTRDEIASYFSEMVQGKYPGLPLSLAWEKYKEECNTLKDKEMLKQITDKLGFDIREYSSDDTEEAYERDNIPNPFDKLSLEELLFIRDNHYFL